VVIVGAVWNWRELVFNISTSSSVAGAMTYIRLSVRDSFFRLYDICATRDSFWGVLGLLLAFAVFGPNPADVGLSFSMTPAYFIICIYETFRLITLNFFVLKVVYWFAVFNFFCARVFGDFKSIKEYYVFCTVDDPVSPAATFKEKAAMFGRSLFISFFSVVLPLSYILDIPLLALTHFYSAVLAGPIQSWIIFI
jgi:hypothetical protein